MSTVKVLRAAGIPKVPVSKAFQGFRDHINGAFRADICFRILKARRGLEFCAYSGRKPVPAPDQVEGKPPIMSGAGF